MSGPIEAGSKGESIPIDPHGKMPNFTTEMNTALPLGTKNGLVSIANFQVHDNSTGDGVLYKFM